MYFKRIELHGFKSFAEPTVIEFDRGITCVVGPNGSGKSNICDAIRWVLGAQSARALRGDKMEDVIFAGTSSRKSRGMAEVTLVIDNEDGALPIDYNEVAITRRMYRSGESEYLINNNRCRMKDIRELIMDTGIGVEGYSIIGQGKISDIISNNTESIREILEETAGIVMYRNRKAEAERKMKSATDNLDRVNDIVGELESRIGGLKEDSEKAQEYLKLRDRHRELEINITLRNIEGIQEKSVEIERDLKDLGDKIGEAQQKKAELDAALTESSRARGDLDTRMDEKRAEEMSLTETINTLVNRQQVDNERLRTLGENIERLKEEISELAGHIEVEEGNAAEMADQLKEAQKKADALNKDLEDAIAVYTDKNGAAAAMTAAMDEKKDRVFALQNAISAKNAEIGSIESLKETLERRRGQVLDDEESAGKDAEGMRADKARLEEERDALAETIREAEAKAEDIRSRRAEAEKEQKELNSSIAALRLSAGEKEARRKALEEMDSSYEGFSGAVRFLMKEDRKGLAGVVADLISVPSGLETAVETALGGALQNVVTEDDDAAKGAVRRLKEAKAGRLTFLPITSIKARDRLYDAKAEKADGFVEYGVDAVSFDERYRTIVEYLLGNVIIMKDMDTAVALSKDMDKNAKLVTLEGEVITGTGAITGGRGKHKTGNILERKGEIARLAEEIAEDEKRRREDEEKLTAAERAIASLSEEQTLAETALAAAKMDHYARETELSVLAGSLGDMDEGSLKRQSELADIDRQRENSDKIIAERRQEIGDAEAEKAKLEAELEEDAAEYERVRDSVRAESDAITNARIAAQAAESEQEKIRALADRVEDTLEQFRGQKTAREDLLAEQEEEIRSLTSRHEEGDDPVAEAMAKKTEVTDALAGLREERTELLATIEADTAARETLEGELSSLQSQKYELEVRNARQETQLENAKTKLWEEFEVSLLSAMDLRSEDFVMSRAVTENREIKARLRELGEVNVGAIEEYAQVKERYEFLTTQREDILTSMDELTGIIRDMDKIIRSRFKTSFDQVVENFEEVFRDLYGGGHAKIELADPDDPFDSEIEITAQPPGKQLKHINLLSGGEKTMTAIALMFAVLRTKPTPCCILDEIEAALDDSNLQIFGRYIKEFKGVQFTLITHQKATMEHADVMYGITMPESGVSRVYSLRMEKEEEPA